jgi:hypothetical protein
MNRLGRLEICYTSKKRLLSAAYVYAIDKESPSGMREYLRVSGSLAGPFMRQRYDQMNHGLGRPMLFRSLKFEDSVPY